jgi:hypothetical protein
MMPRSVVLTAILIASASPMTSQAPNTLSDAERQAGWRLLFDGQTTAGWHGYGKRPFPGGWQVVDGALTRVGLAGDIVTDGSYRDFELEVEWKVPPGGNSGIFYRGIESENWLKTPIHHSAPEMQVLDDAAHADGKSPLTSAGSMYALYPVPPGVAKPAGEWNTARVVVRGRRIEHWLNGTKVVDCEIGSPDWARRVKDSKFSALPTFGTAPEGVIGLQDHGDRVAFRNIKLRVIAP